LDDHFPQWQHILRHTLSALSLRGLHNEETATDGALRVQYTKKLVSHLTLGHVSGIRAPDIVTFLVGYAARPFYKADSQATLPTLVLRPDAKPQSVPDV